MNPGQKSLIIASSIISLTACGTIDNQECPITQPNGNTPPGETPAELYHGSRDLWTAIWPDGKVIFSPGGPPGKFCPTGLSR